MEKKETEWKELEGTPLTKKNMNMLVFLLAAAYVIDCLETEHLRGILLTWIVCMLR